MASKFLCIGSNSEPEDKVPTSPVIAGPPPPPLRGIPHLNPDAVDISDEPPKPQPAVSTPITTVLPSPSRPPFPGHLAAMDGLSVHVGGHQPKLHPVPLLSSPQPNFQRGIGPQASPIQQGEGPLITMASTPLSPMALSPTHRKTSLTLQLDARPAESGIISPSLMPVEQPTHLFREPLLVSPSESRNSKPLLPVASPVAISPVSASPASPSAPEKKPSSIAPSNSKAEVVQERSRGQPKAEAERSEGKDDSSNESSEDSATSDAESTDFQDEARDTFDTSKLVDH